MTPKTPEEIRQLISGLRIFDQKHFDPSAAMEDAADALEWLLQFVEWKPIESASRDKPILISDGFDGYVVAEWDLEEQCFGDDYSGYPLAASFLPLPPPPQQSHWSDCAVNNAPALPVGECNCGGYPEKEAS